MNVHPHAPEKEAMPARASQTSKKKATPVKARKASAASKAAPAKKAATKSASSASSASFMEMLRQNRVFAFAVLVLVALAFVTVQMWLLRELKQKAFRKMTESGWMMSAQDFKDGGEGDFAVCGKDGRTYAAWQAMESELELSCLEACPCQ